MTKEDVLQISDNLVQTLIAMLSTSSGQVGGVQEDAILTFGALVESMVIYFFLNLLVKVWVMNFTSTCLHSHLI